MLKQFEHVWSLLIENPKTFVLLRIGFIKKGEKRVIKHPEEILVELKLPQDMYFCKIENASIVNYFILTAIVNFSHICC